MDRWIVSYFLGLGEMTENIHLNSEYKYHLGVVLKHNPTIKWYFCERCPEAKDIINGLVKDISDNLPKDDVKKSEIYILDAQDSFIVYMYPEIMEELDYIKLWNPEILLSMTNFHDKVVLDIGSGTGRLAFSVADIAKQVYAIEPTGRLREYLRQKKSKLGIQNMRVLDGTIEEIPCPNDTFDIVMSGHVMGDDYDREMKEMTRVVKNGGYIINCAGDDAIKRELNKDLLQLGFEYMSYKSRNGNDIYNYRKKINK
jgi:ubiquinone/menaquinone biosynthesis C-methylase UbiE